jgi:hypothetical protein
VFRSFVIPLLAWLLIVPLLLASAGPALAREVAGPETHVCHCDARHTDCACPLCNPKLEGNLRHASILGVCGDQDVAFGAAHVLGTLPPGGFALAPATLATMVDSSCATLRACSPPPPPTPPPRT